MAGRISLVKGLRMLPLTPPAAGFPSSPALPALLTKILGGRAILSIDCHDSWFEDLQGRDVRGQDTEGAGQRGHIHLLHVGAVVKDLSGESRVDGNSLSPGTAGKERAGSPLTLERRGMRRAPCSQQPAGLRHSNTRPG